MKSKIIYYGILALFVIVLLTSFAYAQESCVGTSNTENGYQKFEIKGNVVYPQELSNGQVILIVDTNIGMFDIFNIVCATNVSDICMSLDTGFTVILSGIIIPQECPTIVPEPYPTQQIRFRANSITVQ